MSIKKRYIVELTGAQINFIETMIIYAESFIMDGSTFQDGILYEANGIYEYGEPRKKEANFKKAVLKACNKGLENGLKTIRQ